MKTEMFAERINKPALMDGRDGKYSAILKEFLESENKTLKYTFTNTKEAQSCKASVQLMNRKHNLNLCVWMKNCEVYVIKG